MRTGDDGETGLLDRAPGDWGDQPAAHAELSALLDDLIDRPDDREAIERRIVERFTERRAVMVLDMSGFSRTTASKGIVTFLLMIHQVRLIAVPCVQLHGGVLIKAEADNLYCVFDCVEHAIEVSLELDRRLAAANEALPDDLTLYVSTGVGYGPILNIGDEDMWGGEVNTACRLGEDIAGRGEILLSQAAREQVGDSSELCFEERTRTVSEQQLKYYRLER